MFSGELVFRPFPQTPAQTRTTFSFPKLSQSRCTFQIPESWPWPQGNSIITRSAWNFEKPSWPLIINVRLGEAKVSLWDVFNLSTLYLKPFIGHLPCEYNNGKGMLSSVEQAFVGRDEIRAPLKMPAWEASFSDETQKMQAFFYFYFFPCLPQIVVHGPRRC